MIDETGADEPGDRALGRHVWDCVRDRGNHRTFEAVKPVSSSGSPAKSIRPRSWSIQPRRIVGTRYHGECVVARVRQATYQQQSTTHGRSAGVFGLTSDGRGFVTGGSGTVNTEHRGVVAVVLEAEDGRHTSQELPAELAVLEGGLLRLDLINGNVFSATNLTGRQGAMLLLGPSAFIAPASFTKGHAFLMVATVFMAGQILSPHPVAGLGMTALFAALPLARFLQIQKSKRGRLELKNYMVEVMS
jgi:hypothetical protein